MTQPGGNPQPSRPAEKRVLIVDDDESVLTLLEILIRRDGFQIESAVTGSEALEKLKSAPDALVLDLMLPGTTSGFEVLRRLPEAASAVPVVVVTAYSRLPEAHEVMRDRNVVAVLPKPIHQGRLLAALHKALNTKPPPDENIKR